MLRLVLGMFSAMRMIRMPRMRRMFGDRFAGMRGVMLGVMPGIMLGRVRDRMPFSMFFSRHFGGLIRRFGRMPMMVVFACHTLTLCPRMFVVPVALPAFAIMCLLAGRRFYSSRRSTYRSNCTPAARFATRAVGNIRTAPVASVRRKWHCRH
jgi:hypothetical protein